MATQNLTRRIVADHLHSGTMEPGAEIGLRVDQTLTQDATGTLVMLELEAMGLDSVRTELSAQYVDHNLVQADHKNSDDHVFLRSACRRFGVWYSRAGNGVSHPVHQEYFGQPGKTLLGSDSHTPAAGALGMLAIGAGGIDVALAMAGEPYWTRMPRVRGVRLVGALPDHVSAKDVILELLRRHDVAGAVGRVLEYHGPGLRRLSVWDRHVIANMGTELGATSSVFPADEVVRQFLARQDREQDWRGLPTGDDATCFDEHEELDLSALEPLAALPGSPGDVVPVREVAGRPIGQAYIGSSANPGFRDLAVAAHMVEGRQVHEGVSFDINPASRAVLGALTHSGDLARLVEAGARLHQAGCNGCIGMGQAPPSGAISLRTVPRNFPGRSGTDDDQVYLVSPETAAASALTGVITDPRESERPYPRIEAPERPRPDRALFVAPLPRQERAGVSLVKGPNVKSMPELDPLPATVELPVLLRVGDNISTDEILRAGARALPLRSNIPAIARFAFEAVDPEYHDRALELRESGGHVVVGGENYGQGSSREHAALAPRHLGLRVVLARSFARIHAQNLVNFGVLPLRLEDPAAGRELQPGQTVRIEDVHGQLSAGEAVSVTHVESGQQLRARHELTPRQVELIARGGIINVMRRRLSGAS